MNLSDTIKKATSILNREKLEIEKAKQTKMI
jgi:hypothetical protein